MAEAPVHKPEMGSLTRTTCFYRQWNQDPSLADARKAFETEITDTASSLMHSVYTASRTRAEGMAKPLWATFQTTTTPPPITTQAYWWLPPAAAGPAPAPAPAAAAEPAALFYNAGQPSNVAGSSRVVTAEVFPRFGGRASSGGFVVPRAPDTFR